MLSIWVAVVLSIVASGSGAATPARLLLPTVAITADAIALVVNDADPASVAVGAYYASARKIPPERIVHLRFATDRPALSADEFRTLKAQVDAAVPKQVQAFALAWTQPWRVDCMSITAAFAFGFDTAYCADGCRLTKPSPYFNHDTSAPFRDLAMRPAMLLAGRSVAETNAMIDRGVRSDGTWPAGKAYLMDTSDRERDVRKATYPLARSLVATAVPVEVVHADALRERRDVMFQFTGLARVAELDTNRFLDGAIADHLTSSGGVLIDSPQMSALDWLHHGATGSYGTAIEPCNFRQKFPEPAVVMARYLSGETLIEAYWKSVQMPGQGVFIGEPLARPFGGVRTQPSASGGVDVSTRALRPGRYLLQGSRSAAGPFRTLGRLLVPAYGVQQFHLPATPPQTYRLVVDPAPEAAPPTLYPSRRPTAAPAPPDRPSLPPSAPPDRPSLPPSAPLGATSGVRPPA